MLTLVAATIRTSVFSALDEPTLMNSPVSKTRNKRTCVANGSSPTSSRKIVPPSATSKYPFLFEVAPVKEPFSCPKSSLSRSSLGIAAQLTGTNCPFFFEDL
jgi:hypothetical protein